MRVAMLAFPQVQILDVTGPLEVFGRAARLLRERGRRGAYEVEIVAARAGPFDCSSGLRLHAGRSIAAAGRIDTLLVAGGLGTEAALADPRLTRWLRRMAPRVRRLGSVCTGAFLLAEAGLLDGRRAATHWQHCADLAARYPRVRVEPDPVFVHDGVYTSAGVTAGMDLALALVEEDFGPELALEVARELVLYVRRPSGQPQLSAQLAGQLAQRRPLRELQAWIGEHLEQDLSLPALARRAGMSPRNFSRAFARETSVPPARYVERARVEKVRRLLQESADGLDRIARECGYASPEVMRRALRRQTGQSPRAYRGFVQCPMVRR